MCCEMLLGAGNNYPEKRGRCIVLKIFLVFLRKYLNFCLIIVINVKITKYILNCFSTLFE